MLSTTQVQHTLVVDPGSGHADLSRQKSTADTREMKKEMNWRVILSYCGFPSPGVYQEYRAGVCAGVPSHLRASTSTFVFQKTSMSPKARNYSGQGQLATQSRVSNKVEAG